MSPLRALFPAAFLLAAPGASAQWEFGEPVVAVAGTEGVFPHLEAAGRASLAIAPGGAVALVWEDNYSGSPQAYVAWGEDGGFATREMISAGRQAYEPAVVAAGDRQFIMAWEQDGAVWLRMGAPGELGTAVKAGAGARQPTLARGPDGHVYAAWVDTAGRHGRVVVAHVSTEGAVPRLAWEAPVETGDPEGDQLYPALAVSAEGVTVGFEDRRHGHTRLYTARLKEGGKGFTAIAQLNELRGGGNAPYGRGSGVTRLALDAGGGRVAAVWMDKRQFRGGYDIYAALSHGDRPFGPNELVQDLFGENQPQWHPDVALSPDGTRVVAAWDDPRDGTPDVWISWRTGEGTWSDDMAPSGGSGAGSQTHPVIAFDHDGRVHAAWIDRPESGPPRILYTVSD